MIERVPAGSCAALERNRSEKGDDHKRVVERMLRERCDRRLREKTEMYGFRMEKVQDGQCQCCATPSNYLFKVSSMHRELFRSVREFVANPHLGPVTGRLFHEAQHAHKKHCCCSRGHFWRKVPTCLGLRKESLSVQNKS